MKVCLPLMPALFKRLEIQVLLLLVVGGLGWVLVHQSQKKPGDAWDVPAMEQAAGRLVRCSLLRDYSNARLEVTVGYQNKGGQEVTLAAPFVKVETADGTQVPPFVLPFQAQAKVAPGQNAEGTLRYWLEERHLQGGLWLVIGEQRLPLKTAGAFALRSLENNKPLVIQSPSWE